MFKRKLIKTAIGILKKERSPFRKAEHAKRGIASKLKGRAKKAEKRKKFLDSSPRTSSGKIIRQEPNPYPAKLAKKKRFLRGK